MKHKKQIPVFLQQYVITVVLLLLTTATTAPAQTTEQIAETALAATLYLEMKNSDGVTLGIGSGFFVKPNQIATNYHVIEGADHGTAKLVGRYTKYTIEGILAKDTVNDLAILKVSAYGIKPLPLGNSDTVKVGATVYVAGNPKGLEGTFSDGIISSLRDGESQKRLQMTAPISPGSSGGPVLNRKGEVIGVSVSVHRDLDAQNLNFVIPVNALKQLLAGSGTVNSLGQENYAISAETYFIWGNIKDDLDDYQGAIADYTKAIQLKPDFAIAYISRGYAKMFLERYIAAISDFNRAIQLKPDYANAYVARGNAKTDLKQYVAAISDYDKAIQLKPNEALAYISRGYAKMFLKRYVAAISDYDKVIQLKPNEADAYCFRGFAKSLIGRTWEAKQDLRTALRLAERTGDESIKTMAENALRRID